MNKNENNENTDKQHHGDEEILLLSLSRPGAFKVLIDRYQYPFLRAAHSIVRNQEEAQDVVQDAFIKIYRNAEKFRRVEGASFKSWAYRIVINTAISRYNALKKSKLAVADAEIPVIEAPFQDEIYRNELKEFVAEVLKKMPENLKLVLQKYYFEEQSIKKISLEENKTIASIKMRLFRARKYFKKIAQKDKDQFIWNKKALEI